MQPIIDFISNYTKITEEEMNAMLPFIHFSSHEKNELLQRQGEIAKRVAFILKGSVRSYYADEKGVEHTTGFTFENKPLVAFDSFTQQTPSGASAITLESTELIWTSHSEFLSFLEAYPKYETILRTILSENMTLQGNHAKLLRISSSRERYQALCKMSPEIIQRVPLKHIASYLDMALETLSRVRTGKL